MNANGWIDVWPYSVRIAKVIDHHFYEARFRGIVKFDLHGPHEWTEVREEKEPEDLFRKIEDLIGTDHIVKVVSSVMNDRDFHNFLN